MAAEAPMEVPAQPSVSSGHETELRPHAATGKTRRFLTRQLRILLTGSAFLLFAVGACYVSWILIPALGFWHRKDPTLKVHRCRKAISRALRFHVDYMRWCRLISYDPRSIEAQLPSGPFVLVANHPTLIDAVLVLAAHPSICCVAKGELFRSPIVGRALRAGAHINAGDGKAGAGAAVALGALERLRGGDPVLVFPEGTRSPAGGLGHFKSGAFRIANWAHVPLVPVLIRASPRCLMRGVPWYTVPDAAVRFDVSVLSASDSARYDGDSVTFRSDTRALLERHTQNL
jgi:1-acyl-sn-glycerol-3-phosphate acyltransferase